MNASATNASAVDISAQRGGPKSDPSVGASIGDLITSGAGQPFAALLQSVSQDRQPDAAPTDASESGETPMKAGDPAGSVASDGPASAATPDAISGMGDDMVATASDGGIVAGASVLPAPHLQSVGPVSDQDAGRVAGPAAGPRDGQGGAVHAMIGDLPRAAAAALPVTANALPDRATATGTGERVLPSGSPAPGEDTATRLAHAATVAGSAVPGGTQTGGTRTGGTQTGVTQTGGTQTGGTQTGGTQTGGRVAAGPMIVPMAAGALLSTAEAPLGRAGGVAGTDGAGRPGDVGGTPGMPPASLAAERTGPVAITSDSRSAGGSVSLTATALGSLQAAVRAALGPAAATNASAVARPLSAAARSVDARSSSADTAQLTLAPQAAAKPTGPSGEALPTADSLARRAAAATRVALDAQAGERAMSGLTPAGTPVAESLAALNLGGAQSVAGALPGPAGAALAAMAPGAPTSAPSAGMPAAPPLSLLDPQAPGTLADTIRLTLGEGRQTARIDLTPVELGALSVEVEQQSGRLAVSLLSPIGATRELIEAMIPRLREQLAGDGHASVSVDVGQRGEEADRRAGRQAEQQAAANDPGRDESRSDRDGQTTGESRRPEERAGTDDHDGAGAMPAASSSSTGLRAPPDSRRVLDAWI